MTEERRRALDALIAKWREVAKLWDDNARTAVYRLCANELASALRADAGGPQEPKEKNAGLPGTTGQGHSLEPTPRREDEPEYTPEQLADLRADYAAWLLARENRVRQVFVAGWNAGYQEALTPDVHPWEDRCDVAFREWRARGVDGGSIESPQADMPANPKEHSIKPVAVDAGGPPSALLTIAGLVNSYHNDGTTLSAAETLRAIADALGPALQTHQRAGGPPAAWQETVQLVVNSMGDVTTLGRFGRAVDPIRLVSDWRSDLSKLLPAPPAVPSTQEPQGD